MQPAWPIVFPQILTEKGHTAAAISFYLGSAELIICLAAARALA